MTIINLRMLTVMFAFTALLGGCCGGSTTTKVEHLSTTKTVGEQMLDLQKARDTGAITEEEYKKAKQDILDKLEK